VASKVKQLVLINDISSQTSIEIAKRFNQLMYPTLIIGRNQSVLDSIEYKNPEIVATVVGDSSDDELITSSIGQAEEVFGRLKVILLVGGLIEEHSDGVDRNDVMIPIDMARYAAETAASGFRLRFGGLDMHGVTLLSVTNVIDVDLERLETMRPDQIPWDQLYNNFEIISINPKTEGTNSTIRSKITNKFVTDEIGKPPYDDVQMAKLVQKISELPMEDSVRSLRITLNPNRAKAQNDSYSDLSSMFKEVLGSQAQSGNVTLKNPEPVAQSFAENIPLQPGTITEVTVRMDENTPAQTMADIAGTRNSPIIKTTPEEVTKLNETVDEFTQFVNQITSEISPEVPLKNKKAPANTKKSTTKKASGSKPSKASKSKK
jgi:hypothetical protein